MKTSVRNIKKKFKALANIFKLLLKGEFCLFFCEIAHLVPNWLFRFNAGVVMATSSPKIICRNYRSYTFSRADLDDVPEISKVSGIPENTLLERCKQGDSCHLTKDNCDCGKVVNVLWSHRGPCYIRGFGLNLQVDNDSVYLYGAFTKPEARMKGIINTAIKETYEYYHNNGVNNIYGLVEKPNRNSYNFHLKLNFKPVAEVMYITFMFFKLSYYRNLENGKRNYCPFISIPQNMIII